VTARCGPRRCRERAPTHDEPSPLILFTSFLCLSLYQQVIPAYTGARFVSSRALPPYPTLDDRSTLPVFRRLLVIGQTLLDHHLGV
jgi:hypothetical protein